MSARLSTFAELWESAAWVPIRKCPGRYKLVPAENTVPLSALVGATVEVEEHRVSGARDIVLIARLIDGGLITYRRTDGTYVHTLNTESGFRRKLMQLGIKR